jgi:hypothetical protein
LLLVLVARPLLPALRHRTAQTVLLLVLQLLAVVVVVTTAQQVQQVAQVVVAAVTNQQQVVLVQQDKVTLAVRAVTQVQKVAAGAVALEQLVLLVIILVQAQAVLGLISLHGQRLLLQVRAGITLVEVVAVLVRGLHLGKTSAVWAAVATVLLSHITAVVEMELLVLLTQVAVAARTALAAQAFLSSVTSALNVAQVEQLFLPVATHTTHLHRLARIQHKENLNGTFCKSC